MKLNNQIIIAVDGHSSCGKSTFAKQIAQKLNYIYIDSGAMYRAVAYYAIKNNLVQEKHILVEELIKQLPDIHIRFQRNPDGDLETLLNNENIEEHIRGVAVSELVSEVSKIKEVRAYLVKLQQEMGQHKGIVMDGRDIGTVVFPEAEIKLFMTAQPEVRAKRRYDELIAKGIDVSFESILKNVLERDYNDSNRKESPLIQAEDAVVLDNSNMTIEDQMPWLLDVFKNKNLID
ncbi:MAG TPA: (d)CMP kinase [Bacteroidales bacterium]|jgi:cytidylate kinase|nr:(d)CMP kinase [Bacteroidales bacterium]